MDLGKVFTEQYERYAEMKDALLVQMYVHHKRFFKEENADDCFLSKLALLERVNYDMVEFNRRVIHETERQYKMAIESDMRALEMYKNKSTEELGRIVKAWGHPDGPGDYAALCTAETALEMRLEPLNIYPPIFIGDC